MNKSDLVARMTERLSGDRATAAAAVSGVLAEIEDSVARGERVSLSGFGTFERRERAPRTGRNPRTGEAIQVGRSVVPVFRAGARFKTLLTQASGAAPSSGSAAVEDSVPRTEGSKVRAAASSSSGGTAVVAAEAAGDGKKKAGKQARDRAGKKGSQKASKAGENNKAGKGKAGKKKAAGGIR